MIQIVCESSHHNNIIEKEFLTLPTLDMLAGVLGCRSLLRSSICLREKLKELIEI